MPPRLAERLLRMCLPPGTVGDSIVGDAREEYAAYVRGRGPLPRLWYWIHALSIGRAYVGEVAVDALLKDLRFGARSLARDPGSAIVSVLILALGIGLSTFMFSLVYGVLVRGLDVPDPDRIAVLAEVDTRQEGNSFRSVPGHDLLDFRERLSTVEGLGAYYGRTVNLADEEGPERFNAVMVTANAFDLLRVRPVLGRTFAEGEDAPGLPPTVILGYSVWRDRYGSDPAVVGRGVRVNGVQGTIVGVMPEGFRWPSNHDLWITMDDDIRGTARGEERRFAVFTRLADGVSWEQAGAEAAGVAAQLEREHPELNEGMSARLLTVAQQQNGDEIAMIFTAMMVAVLGVLLIACANVANLLLARAAARTREAGVRVALGAGRLRMMAPFLAEALVLAAAGAVLGTAIAYQAVEMFDRATDPSFTGRPYFVVFTVDFPELLWAVGVTLFTAVVAGLIPALQVSRADVGAVLKDESRGSSSLHLGRLSKVLVTVEVALSVALLVGAGLMTKSMVRLATHELPFAAERYLQGRISLTGTDYEDVEDRRLFWEDLERRVRALPSVDAAGLTSVVPATGGGTETIRLEGETYAEPSDRPRTHSQTVTPGYFELLGVRLVEGEDFSEGHVANAQRVAIVNRSFGERFWPGESAIGRRFRTGTADTVPWMTVIGVAPDLQMEGFQPQGAPSAVPDGFYVPLAQNDARSMALLAVASSGPPITLVQPLRDEVRAMDPDLPLFDVRTVKESVDRAGWFYSVFGTVFIVFGAVALFMASVGLYGVLSFAVTRRTSEMGIRMALGAGSRQVVRLVLRQGATQLVVGLVVGLVLAAGVSRVVAILMYQVDPRDPTVFAGVVGVIVGVALLSSFVPARRATAVDPIVAMRAE